MSIFGGHWYLCFGFLVMNLGFKARVGSALFVFFFAEVNVMYIPQDSTSGATCANLLVAGSTAGHFPTYISRGGTWLGFEQAITQREEECTTIVPVTRLSCYKIITLEK